MLANYNLRGQEASDDSDAFFLCRGRFFDLNFGGGAQIIALG